MSRRPPAPVALRLTWFAVGGCVLTFAPLRLLELAARLTA